MKSAVCAGIGFVTVSRAGFSGGVAAFLALCLAGSFNRALAQTTYAKMEASFTVNAPMVDPSDYSNDLRVLIVQPDASAISLPAFFDGGATWRVRHTPTMPGAYSISNITLNGSAVAFANLQPAPWIVSGNGFPAGDSLVRLNPGI